MDPPIKVSKQIACNKRPKIGKHMLIEMHESMQGENLSHPFRSNKKRFKIAVTFLTGYTGIFKITEKTMNSVWQNHLLTMMVLSN